MRPDLHVLDEYRIEVKVGAGAGPDGAAYRPGELNVIASWGGGWDHVSVSLPDRCPSWQDMEAVRRMFFAPEEAVMQLHPPELRYRSIHPYCLHLWRPQNERIPLPPVEFV